MQESLLQTESPSSKPISSRHADRWGQYSDDDDDHLASDGDREPDDESASTASTVVFPFIKDKYQLVYFIFLWLGLAGTVPWNFFITAEEYWQYKVRNVSHIGPLDPKQRTSLQTNFSSYLSMAAMVPSLLGYAVCSMMSSRFPVYLRVVVSLAFILAQLVFTIFLCIINTDKWQFTFFTITMVSVGIMNGFNAVFQATSFGMASLLPAKYVRVSMTGQAVGGILCAVARILTLLSNSNESVAAIYFFCLALAIVLFAVVSYFVLVTTPYYRFHNGTVAMLRKCTVNTSTESSCDAIPSFRQVLNKVWLYGLSSALVLFATLAVYPSVAVLVVSVSIDSGSSWTGKFFLPFACFLLFNCGDLCGRCISAWIPLFAPNSYFLPAVCFLRLSLVPLFMLCNAQPRHHLPVVFDSDTAYVILISLLSVSNGYLATLCMVVAPTVVKKGHRELAGIVMSLFMAIGIGLGALVGSVFVDLL